MMISQGRAPSPSARDCDATPCVAQTLPAEVLHAIFLIVSHGGDALTLASCTLVCRSWCIESSTLLLKHIHSCCLYPLRTTPPEHQCQPSAPGLRFRLTRLSPASRSWYTFYAAVESHRITSNLRELELSTCHGSSVRIDFHNLKAAIARLHMLRTLALGPLRFKPSRSGAGYRPYSTPAADRQVLDALVFRDSLPDPDAAPPLLLDVIFWFRTIKHLDISRKNAIRGGILLPHSPLLPDLQPAVTRLSLDSLALDVFMAFWHPLAVLNLLSLSSFTVTRLDNHDVESFNAFMAAYGRQLEECSVCVCLTVPRLILRACVG